MQQHKVCVSPRKGFLDGPLHTFKYVMFICISSSMKILGSPPHKTELTQLTKVQTKDQHCLYVRYKYHQLLTQSTKFHKFNCKFLKFESSTIIFCFAHNIFLIISYQCQHLCQRIFTNFWHKMKHRNYRGVVNLSSKQ